MSQILLATHGLAVAVGHKILLTTAISTACNVLNGVDSTMINKVCRSVSNVIRVHRNSSSSINSSYGEDSLLQVLGDERGLLLISVGCLSWSCTYTNMNVLMYVHGCTWVCRYCM